MERIERVEYYLSQLTKEQAFDNAILKEWNKLHNNLLEYQRYKQEIVNKGLQFSEASIEWLFVNDVINPENYVEFNLKVNEQVDDIRTVYNKGLDILYKELDKLLFNFLNNYYVIDEDKTASKLIESILKVTVLGLPDIILDDYERGFEDITSALLENNPPYLHTLILIKKGLK